MSNVLKFFPIHPLIYVSIHIQNVIVLVSCRSAKFTTLFRYDSLARHGNPYYERHSGRTKKVCDAHEWYKNY